MGWFLFYCSENIRLSIGQWRVHSAMIGMVVSILPAFAAFKLSNDNVTLGILIWFGVLLFVITPIRMWKQQYDELTELKSKGLEIVYNPMLYSACQMHVPHGGITYRLGVRAIGRKTIEKVEVKLENFEPQGNPFGAVPLEPLDPYLNPFSVNPSDRPLVFVNVVSWAPGQEITIHYDSSTPFPPTIPAGRYIFRISASGQDTPGDPKEFDVFVTDDGDRLVFREH